MFITLFTFFLTRQTVPVQYTEIGVAFKIPKDWLTDDIFSYTYYSFGKKELKKQKSKAPEVWMRSYCRNCAIYHTSLTHGKNTSWFK